MNVGNDLDLPFDLYADPSISNKSATVSESLSQEPSSSHDKSAEICLNVN